METPDDQSQTQRDTRVRPVKGNARVPGISFVFPFFLFFEVRSKKASDGPVPLPRVNTPDMQDQDVRDARVRYATSEQNESVQQQKNRWKISASPALTSNGLELTMRLNSDTLGKSPLTRALRNGDCVYNHWWMFLLRMDPVSKRSRRKVGARPTSQ